MKFSNEFASSQHDAISNDSLKDADNGIWLINLPESIQSIWLQRFYWIRWVDRLAEQDRLVRPGGPQFSAFYQAWKRLLVRNALAPDDRSWQVLQQIEACWFQSEDGDLHRQEIAAWDHYIEAMLDYHQLSLAIRTLDEYEFMLKRLAGACFQCLPFLADHHRQIAEGFGVVDQFYNNLRDLYEDASRGICYFPTELLNHFGLSRQEILTLSCLDNPGYSQLIHYWLNDYLPRLRQKNLALVVQPDLHPAWQALTHWFLHRYARIEQTMRDCGYNCVDFTDHYWRIVKQDLATRLLNCQQRSAHSPISAYVLRLTQPWNEASPDLKTSSQSPLLLV